MAEQSIGALALKAVDIWAWWRKALANPSEIGKSLPVHDGVPNQGYYRVRYGKDKPYEPVAIWMEDGAWLAYRGGKEAKADEIWTFCCRSPISYETYQAVMIDGQAWPDDDKVVASQLQPPEPTIGDNSAEVDEAETLKDQIEAALAGTDAYKVIPDDATAAKALSLRNRLNELSGTADKVRVKLKAPFLEAGKAVDDKFQPMVKSAKAGADKVKQAIADWETKKHQELRKREREAEAARKVEQDRLDALESARQRQPDAELMEAPTPAIAPVAIVEVAPTAIKPTYGKAASVSVKIVVDEITDQLALYTYMAGREEVQTLLRQLAQKALDAGRTAIPGITTTERANVR